MNPDEFLKRCSDLIETAYTAPPQVRLAMQASVSEFLDEIVHLLDPDTINQLQLAALKAKYKSMI